MNDRKNGLLLSGFLFLCVWLILFLVAVTETGGVKYNFAVASTLAAFCGVVCMGCYFTLDYMEKRKDASGIYNFEYYRLKRRTRKELEQAREDLSEKAYDVYKTIVAADFENRAYFMGVAWDEIAKDFKEIAGAVK